MAARPRQISDREILEAAASCFLEHGPGISTQVIADKLSISQAALFKRFNTKEELILRSLLPPEKPPILDWLESGPSDAPLRPQLASLIETMWEMVSFVVPRISAVNASGIPHSAIKGRYKKFPLVSIVESLAGWISRAQEQGRMKPCGSPRDLALAWLGMLQGRALLRFFLNDIAPSIAAEKGTLEQQGDEDYISTITELLWRAVGDEADASSVASREKQE